MKNITVKFFNALAIALVLLSITTVKAQELSVGADFVSRYIWRGFDLGSNTPSLQPTIELTAGGFTAGFWGAYSFSDPEGLNEIDIYASYALELDKSGSISFGVIDYTNPNSGTKIGNFNNYDDEDGPGAHFIEINAGYSGPEDFPISLSLNYFVYNVANNPFYIQAGYDTSIKEVGLSMFIGATPGDDNGYYGVTELSIINMGFTASKEIKITDSFSLPIFGSIILNPASEDLFYVLGISL